MSAGANAPVEFCGIQQGAPELGLADIELWNLTAAVPGHPVRSTVSRQTLEALGYVVPAAPVFFAQSTQVFSQRNIGADTRSTIGGSAT